MKEKKFWVAVALGALAVVLAWGAELPVAGGINFSLRELNRLFAILGFWFFFVQFLLSSRTKLIEAGFGLDKMIRYHRRVGRAALLFLLLHPLFLFMQESSVSIGNLYRVIGLIVLVALAGTAVVAATYKRLQLKYEVWLNIHKLNYILFPLALLHVFYNSRQGSLLYWAWVLLAALYAILVVHKIRREIEIRSNPYEVVQVTEEADGIWSLAFKGRQLAYKPGQFMYLRLLRRGKLSSPHPFTISSSPTWDVITVTPKELGDFTSTVKDTKPGDLALIDAPFGTFSFLNFDCDRLVFIAGGIGITPFMSMLRYMRDLKTGKQVTLFWGNKDKQALCFETELNEMAEAMDNLTLVLVMSAQEDWQGEKGRISGSIIEKYVPDLDKCHFFVCGPPPLSMAIIASLLEKRVPSEQIHHELFEI